MLRLILIVAVLGTACGQIAAICAQESKRIQSPGKADSQDVSSGTSKDASSALAGKWLEVNFEHAGRTQNMTESDGGPPQSVDTIWNLSPEKRPHDFTRHVLYGDTELDEGSLNLGSYAIDTSVDPHRITFDHDGHVIPGIFRLRGEHLLIALPYHRYNFGLDAMEVGRRPESFSTSKNELQGGRGHRNPGPTVYRLRRIDDGR